MAATVWVALLLVVSLHTEPAQGYRIRKDRSHTLSSTGGLIHQVGQRRLLQGDNPCGQFADSDPYDGVRDGQMANWHTPCYAGDGSVFCCPAGSTECSCPPNPPSDSSNPYCYNYILSNDLNSNTNQPCAAFVPGKDPSASSAAKAATATPPTPSSADPPTSGDPPSGSPVAQTSAATNPQTSAGITGSSSGGFTFPQGTGAPLPLQPDKTCGTDPNTGQTNNLCTNSNGIQWCCSAGNPVYVCPTADPTVASNPAFSMLAYICIPLGSMVGNYY